MCITEELILVHIKGKRIFNCQEVSNIFYQLETELVKFTGTSKYNNKKRKFPKCAVWSETFRKCADYWHIHE